MDAIDRAMALDPESGEVYASLGGMAWVFEGDAEKAAPLIERAIMLDPWNLDVIAFGAEFAKFIGRIDEALVLEQLLVDRDPLCMQCRRRLGYTYLYLGRFDDAEREFRTLYAWDERAYLRELGLVSLFQGRPQEALDLYERIDAVGGRHHLAVQGRAMALSDLGRREEAEAAFAELIALRGESYPLAVVQAYAYVGRTEEAFDWLDASLPSEGIELATDYLTPLYGSLHDDPRWQQIIASIGRSPEQVARISFELDTVLHQR